MSKGKNASKSIPNGRTLQTRDEFLASGKGKKNIKPDHPNKFDLYRTAVVVDTNKNEDIAIIKLTTSKKGKNLKGYRDGLSNYRPYIEVETAEGKSIRFNKSKFKQNSPKRDVPKYLVNKMKKNALRRAPKPIREENRKRLRRLKGR